MTTFDRAIDRVADAFRSRGLKVATATGGKYSAQCPVDGARDRRVSISQKGEKASVRCHKGCLDTDVLAAVGLTVTDLYDKPGATTGRAPVEVLEGQDELDLDAPDPEPSDWDGLPITRAHARVLEGSAITPEVAKAAGVYSVTRVDQLPEEFAGYGAKAVPALAFPWVSPSGQRLVQLRPDKPITRDDGTESKYLWPAGVSSILNVIRPVDDADTALIVEGTKQGLAGAAYAPPTVAVYGIAGCRSWSTDGMPLADLEVVDGKKVVLVFDADLATNPDVHAAADRLTEAVKAEGATEVRYLTLPAGGKAGLDDVLAQRAEDKRAQYLGRLISLAKAKLPAKPARKPKKDAAEEDAPAASFFGDEGEGLLVEKLYHAITAQYPAALTRERRVALYRNGVFHIDGAAFIGAVTRLLGDRFRPGHRAAAEEFAVGTLYNAGLILPERCDVALLNVRNGMLDLATGTLKPHDPSYLSSAQLPIDWDQHATCPTYEKWLKDAIGDQIDDLEESTSAMLDPSRTPTKAMFLFGPSRSGKSTYLRLMQAVAGLENMAAVTLHQLVDNRFASANIYGKILNCAADVSSAHVNDVSIFKMMTGEDPIQADRKFGSQFAFVNRALFAFSANELPTVSESSRAYVERIKPFEFAKSFAGSEDPSIEVEMMKELSGILVRWVRAWQRMTERGGYRRTDERVRQEFEKRSDRVRQWVAEACRVVATTSAGVAVAPGALLPPYEVSTKRELAQAFNRWAEESNGARMGERKIIDRLVSIKGIYEVRRSTDKVRALNVVLRDGTDEVWSEDETPSGGSFGAAGGRNDALVAETVAVSGTVSATVSPQVTPSVNPPGGRSGSFKSHSPCSPENAERRAMNDVDLESEGSADGLARVGKSAETATSATTAQPTGTRTSSPDPLSCTTCREPLDPVHADTGTHPGCAGEPGKAQAGLLRDRER